MPTLLPNGENDLFTPVEWARWEAAQAPLGELYVALGAGHGVQARAPSVQAKAVAAKFLLS